MNQLELHYRYSRAMKIASEFKKPLQDLFKPKQKLYHIGQLVVPKIKKLRKR